MAPAIEESDMVLCNPVAYASTDPKRFDIVVFDAVTDGKQRPSQPGGKVLYFKRIVGLPGENVELRNDDLYINGQYVNEPYEVSKSDRDPKRDYGPIKVPEGEYFVLGDNRPESNDSRFYPHPTIKRSEIGSKVVEVKKGFYGSN